MSPPLSLWDGLLRRRDLLRVGAVSAAGAALACPDAQAAEMDSPVSAKSVIVLWMGGGVTHIDSFDPKPHAIEEIRGELTDIATSVPGVRFCETLPCLAAMADKLAVVRSFAHGEDDHLLAQVHTLSGRKVDRTQLFSEPNIGALVSYLLGPRNGLPGYIAVPGITRPGPPPHNLFVAGWLGSQHAPYCLGGLPAEPDFTVGEKQPDPSPQADEDLTPRSLSFTDEAPLARLNRRAGLRQAFDSALARLDRLETIAGAEGQHENALRLLNDPRVRTAFEIAGEPSSVRERYGRTKIGGRCLMARRLVEAGARFVMVDYGYDPDYGNLWDNHCAPGQNQPHISTMCRRGYHLVGMDRAFAGLIGDLAERGLLDSTLVVFLTEFGRTPKINPAGGRDHWGAAGSIFFAGAKVRAGQAIGETDKHAARPLTRPYTPSDVAATIYHALGVDFHGFARDFQDRPRPILEQGRPIPEVTGAA
jgi:hypothetical protein